MKLRSGGDRTIWLRDSTSIAACLLDRWPAFKVKDQVSRCFHVIASTSQDPFELIRAETEFCPLIVGASRP